MSVFNYKAVFIRQEENEVFYSFYPEYICFENVTGEFRIDLESWKIYIISKANINDWDSAYCNERPAMALTYKIRKFFEDNNKFPMEVFHIA
ncbi:MAG TPA: hypothetical protein VIL74_03645 [Pyrinomonadaceae bacterium]|jgi:hypothetical protein